MKLLIADDHPIFRKGLKDILISAFPKAEITECENGSLALNEILKNQPNVAILDINMPGLNGLEIIKHAIQQKTNSKLIILTMHNEKEMIRKAMMYGAKGYILKDNAVQEIVVCINQVMANNKYMGPATSSFYKEFPEDDKKKNELNMLLRSLSHAELKTLKLVSQNKTSKEISDLLFLSEKTIENYRSRICQKLNLPARNNSLVIWVNENHDLLNSISEF
jgi:DNA-binding NarL/FixJ family response regulator